MFATEGMEKGLPKNMNKLILSTMEDMTGKNGNKKKEVILNMDPTRSI